MHGGPFFVRSTIYKGVVVKGVTGASFGRRAPLTPQLKTASARRREEKVFRGVYVIQQVAAVHLGWGHCWDSKIVPLSYSHNTGVNGPEEFKLIVQQTPLSGARAPLTPPKQGRRVQPYSQEYPIMQDLEFFKYTWCLL